MSDTPSESPKRTIVAEPLTLESFAPFGRVLAAEGERWAPGNVADVYSCGRLDADVPVEFIVARADMRPLTVTFLERHFQLAQTFVSLNGAPFVLLVGDRPADDAESVARADDLRAFIVPGDRGVTVNKKVWHEAPLPLVNGAVLLATSHASLNVALQESNVERKVSNENDIDRRSLIDELQYVVRVELL